MVQIQLTSEGKIIPSDAPGLRAYVPQQERADLLEKSELGVTPDDYELFRRLTIPTHKNELGGTLDHFGMDTTDTESSLIYPLKYNNQSLKAEDVLEMTTNQSGQTVYTVKPEMQEVWDTFQQRVANQKAKLAGSPDKYEYAMPGVDKTSGQVYPLEGTNQYDLATDNLGFYDVMKVSGMSDPYVMSTLAYNFERGNVFNEIKEGGRDLLRLPFNLADLLGVAKDYAQAYAGAVVEPTLNIVPFASPGTWMRENVPFFRVQNPSVFLDERSVSRQIIREQWKRKIENQWGFTNFSKQTMVNNWTHQWIQQRMVSEYMLEADTDGDGKVSQAEAKVATEAAMTDYRQKYTTVVRKVKDQPQFIKTKVVGDDVGQPVDVEYEMVNEPKLLVNERQAQEIMDYAFYQLPFYEKGLKWMADFAPFMISPITSAGKSERIGKIVNQLKELSLNKKGGTVGGVKLTADDVKNIVQGGGAATPKTIHLNYLLHQTSDTAGIGHLQRLLIRGSFFPGKFFGTEGLASQGINALSSRQAFVTLNGELKLLYANRKSLLANGDKKGAKALDVKIDNLKSKLYHLGTGSRRIWMHPSIKGTFHGEMAVVGGQMAGYYTLPQFFNIDRDTGEVIGALFTAFQGHRLGIRIGKGVDTLLSQPFQKVGVDSLTFVEDIGKFFSKAARDVPVVGGPLEGITDTILIQPGQLVNRNLDEIEDVLISSGAATAINGGAYITPRQREAFRFAVQMVQGLPPEEQKKVWGAILETHQQKERLLENFISFTESETGASLKRSQVKSEYFAQDGTRLTLDEIFERPDGTWVTKQGELVTAKYTNLDNGKEVIRGNEHFDPELRALFQQTFGDMTAYAPIEGMQSRLAFSLSYGDISRGNLTKILPIIREEERKRNAIMAGVALIRDKAKAQGLKGKELDAISEWTDGVTSRFNNMKNAIEERNIFYKEALLDYKEKILTINGPVGGAALADGVLEDIMELDMHFLNFKDLQPADRLLKEKEYIDQFFTEALDALHRNSKELEGFTLNKKTLLHKQQNLEKVLSVLELQRKADAQVGFNAMPKELKEMEVDISDFSQTFFGKLKEISAQPLYELFSREGRFFKGANGRRVRRGLTKSIRNAFDEAGFDSDIQSEIMSILHAQTGATNLDITDLFFMLKGNSFPKLTKTDKPIDVPEGLREAIGKETVDSMEELFEGLGDDLKVTSNFKTMEEMYRHFNLLARRTKNKSEADEIFNFVQGLDDVLQQNAEAYPQLAKARELYQKEWFDRTRPNGVWDTAENSKQGPERKLAFDPSDLEQNADGIYFAAPPKGETVGTFRFAFDYAQDNDPTTWFKTLRTSFLDLVQGKTLKETGQGSLTVSTAESNFRTAFEDQMAFWGDTMINKDGVEVLGFDLTTKLGQLKYDLFKDLVENDLVESWAELNQFLVRGSIVKGEETKSLEKVVEFIKPMSDNVEQKLNIINDLTQVNIKDTDGVREASLINFNKLIKSERNLTNLMIENKEVVKIAENVNQKVNRKIEQNETILKSRYNKDIAAIQVFEKMTGIKDSKDFVLEYIINGNGGQKLEALIEDLLNPEITKIKLAGKSGDFSLTTGEKKVAFKPDVSEEDVAKSQAEMETVIETVDGGEIVEVDISDTMFLADRMQHIKKDLLTNKSGPYAVEPLDEETVRRLIAELTIDGILKSTNYGPTENKIVAMIKNKVGFRSVNGFTDGGGAFASFLSDDKVVNPNSAMYSKALMVALGEEGYEAIKAFGSYVTANQKVTGSTSVRLQGLLREITPNEALSRGFNLARGMVGPYYVAAEVYLRIAGSHGIDVMRMAVHSPEAGQLMGELITNPKGFDVRKTRSFITIFEEFIATELATMGKDLPEEITDEFLEELYYMEQTDPELYHKHLDRVTGRKEGQIYEVPTGLVKD